jgi:predicted metal-dependent hydrolase
MKCELHSVQYGKLSIDYTVVRRKRKTLEIAVEPDSTVAVAAPFRASAESVASKVRKRAAWILKQQRYFERFSPRTPERRYVPGETHLYLGRQYRLKVVKSALGSVKLLHGQIVVQSSRPETSEETRRLLDNWYGIRARLKFNERLDACLQRFSHRATVLPSGLTVRSMQKRWGSMSKGRRLLLNRRLVQAPIDTIDYVITHELCHIIEPSHSPKYYKILGRAMHDWEKRKERLEQFLA